MNILVIGNGFDLAHDLPTKYEHFLEFTKAYEKYSPICKHGKSVEAEWKIADDRNKEYLIYFANLCEKKKKLFAELGTLIEDNVWLKYFDEIYESRKRDGKDGWIDFESEISDVIQEFDNIKKKMKENLKDGSEVTYLKPHQIERLEQFFVNEEEPETVEEIGIIKKYLLKDLDRLIRCLEIYLSDFIGGGEEPELLPDIESLPYLDKVLSFNYTNTYERLYKQHPFLEYDYIHGKAEINNTIDSNNMVLGIDEFLKGEEKNENIEFIEFKKFYQRIHKETGCLYRNWVDEVKSNKAVSEITALFNKDGNDGKQTKQVSYHKVFFFGHSLDITDKDVLRDFILNDNVQTTIFYLNKSDYGRKIANLVKVIGQDELIKRTGGATKTITFKKIAEKE